MTSADLIQYAYALGFKGCYLLKPAFYPGFSARRATGELHADAAHLVADPAEAYPWANTVVALLYPYAPYAESLRVSGYYVASNAAYHAAAVLSSELMAAGVQNERAALPVRETLLRAGIGIACKSGLTAVPPFGTRFAVQLLAAALPEPDYFSAELQASRCTGCGWCETACPSGAISATGLDWTKCLRAYMGGEMMPDWVMERLPSLLGCEKCQYACPYNAGIAEIAERPEAFALQKLLTGGQADALALIGKNMKTNGRLLQHAAILAAQEGRAELLPEIERLCSDDREAVRAAAMVAISLLHRRGK